MGVWKIPSRFKYQGTSSFEFVLLAYLKFPPHFAAKNQWNPTFLIVGLYTSLKFNMEPENKPLEFSGFHVKIYPTGSFAHLSSVFFVCYQAPVTEGSAETPAIKNSQHLNKHSYLENPDHTSIWMCCVGPCPSLMVPNEGFVVGIPNIKCKNPGGDYYWEANPRNM